MQWTTDTINHLSFQVLGIERDELIILQNLLKKQLEPQKKKLEKLRDIHESGEATSKQEDQYAIHRKLFTH